MIFMYIVHSQQANKTDTRTYFSHFLRIKIWNVNSGRHQSMRNHRNDGQQHGIHFAIQKVIYFFEPIGRKIRASKILQMIRG